MPSSIFVIFYPDTAYCVVSSGEEQAIQAFT